MIMSKIKYYTDSMVLAVVFNEYEAVKTLIENGNYDKTVFKDIGSDYYFDIPIPVYYISKCWEICLNHDFSASFNPIVQKNYENVKKILALFKEKAGLQEIEIPFSKIGSACWSFEDDIEEDILEGKKTDFIYKGIREIDLDLYIAVQTMNFQKAEELLKNGANPHYKHYGESDGDLLDLCGAECSYQATCQAGEIIRSPGLFRNAIDEEEIGNIFRWAASEKMYELLNTNSL